MSRYNLLTAAAIFIVGWMTHGLVGMYSQSTVGRITQVREDSAEYTYINPLLYIDNSHYTYEKLNPLKDRLENYVDGQINDNKITRASVYFRDLNSGAWTGVNPDDKYVPASMLKVVLLVTYLRLTENDSRTLEQKLAYRKNPNELQNYPPSKVLDDGTYTISELLGQAIIESDNAASTVLLLNTREKVNEFYATLRLPSPPVKLVDYMSTRDISRIFRSLYSSTYLLNSYSEQALEFLTKTKFNKGITAPIDSNIKVAHKFGEHTVYYTEREKTPDYQLHDCGIVYYPEKPYFLCVMSEGKNLENLEKLISSISTLVYSFVDE